MLISKSLRLRCSSEDVQRHQWGAPKHTLLIKDVTQAKKWLAPKFLPCSSTSWVRTQP